MKPIVHTLSDLDVNSRGGWIFFLVFTTEGAFDRKASTYNLITQPFKTPRFPEIPKENWKNFEDHISQVASGQASKLQQLQIHQFLAR